MEDPFATIGFALKMAQQALRTHLDSALQQIGLTMPQYAVLNCLKIEPGASNAALARRSFVTPQTMQGIVVALERAGFILRAPHPNHGRVRTTELTARGREVVAAASVIVVGAEARLREASAPLDPQTVAATLRRLAEALR
ncbi:MarR family winged helix-turn-helix transcriptional regulator [Jiella pacifica]|uniref:MarR family transcriptional regulator n=1 Tax=Jiella pacifica TaxID=2696469 RepID=A0A6N9T7Z0_9HYPH|nr:MarR family transcriptional regulator [Jiella pacifica]NDW07547.1 MarR family transcriptional regulator [Jiella pacifica]